MEWKKNKERNQKIKELRANGKSVREIAKTLCCSKSTVSYYCRGTDRLPQKYGGNGGLVVQQEWQERIDEICDKARIDWLLLRLDPQFMGFLGIYWGEGFKAKSKGRRTGTIGITNNDPMIVKAAVNYLQPLTNSTIGAIIIYYPSHNKQKCERFWKQLLPGITIKIQKNTDERSQTKWSDSCKWGRCRVRFSDFELFWRITTWIDCWRDELGGVV